MRIEGQGLIDRSRPVSFTFDGTRYGGFEGDTLASALLANDVRLMGRSFKYHRPRGVLSAGSEEPNALVTVGSGAAADPNVRATVQEVFDGLQARSQNRWPSLSWDMMAVNDLASPFLGAGFYYKTFMWPKAFWEKLYEPVIRRAAGLGRLSGQADPARCEKAWAHCDLLIIGAGPAGLQAALTAGRAGADVILADEDARMGGRLLAESAEIDGQSGPGWVAEVLAELGQMPNVRLMARTTVAGVYDGGTFGALERVGHHLSGGTGDLPRECFWRIVARQAVLAAGSIERPVAFQNNDKPGIMTAGAVRCYLNRYGVSPGKNVAVFGNNDDALRTADDLLASGVHLAAVSDSRPDASWSGDAPFFAGAQVRNARGGLGLESISVQTASGIENISADCLAMSGGWNPSVHLTCHQGARPVWREDIQAFVPAPDAVPGLIPAGACAGIMDTSGCLADGHRAASEALKALGRTTPKFETPEAENAPYALAPLWAVPGTGRAWLDFQNDVTVKDVKAAAQENFRSVEHMKRYTTQGMATDQGKNSNVAALAVLADVTGRGIPETGTTTFRPPFSPVSIAAMGAGGRAEGFAPQRCTTSHQATIQRNAPMIEAGLWYRPSYFPAPGETTWRQSCDREVAMVRSAVGICDVSTLGKIDIQGPDAAVFLDLLYANTFSTLKVGRVRYGLMLREDGFVMDDGTTARMGDNHFVMTTTTAAAGQVMRHMEFVHQCLRPDLNVRFISATEQWAQFAVAGPKSRELLNGLLDQPIDNDSFPYMSCGEISLCGVNGRLFRISFSGEHAYEVAVPARFGDNLFRLLVSQAETLGGGPYGMEALNVLRIEKGFITHSEIHGRITAFDVGMGRMVSAKKDCIGQTMSKRPGLSGDDREQLVALKVVGAVKELTAGAHLFTADDPINGETSQGYVTSVAYSPTFGHFIGLGFLKDGPSRIGEHMKLVDHVRDIQTSVEICDPVQFDPEGGRLRG